MDKEEFLSSVAEVSEEYLVQARADHPLDDIYPVYMTGSFYNDPRIKEFSDYVGQTAWNILNEQGYDVGHYLLTFSEMWTQEHYRHSSMEQHIHGSGSGGTSGTVFSTPNSGNGGTYGGGGGGYLQGNGYAFICGNGGSGAVRIVWPGTTRQFPSTCVSGP